MAKCPDCGRDWPAKVKTCPWDGAKIKAPPAVKK